MFDLHRAAKTQRSLMSQIPVVITIGTNVIQATRVSPDKETHLHLEFGVAEHYTMSVLAMVEDFNGSIPQPETIVIIKLDGNWASVQTMSGKRSVFLQTELGRRPPSSCNFNKET